MSPELFTSVEENPMILCVCVLKNPWGGGFVRTWVVKGLPRSASPHRCRAEARRGEGSSLWSFSQRARTVLEVSVLAGCPQRCPGRRQVAGHGGSVAVSGLGWTPERKSEGVKGGQGNRVCGWVCLRLY